MAGGGSALLPARWDAAFGSVPVCQVVGKDRRAWLVPVGVKVDIAANRKIEWEGGKGREQSEVKGA